MKNSCVSGDALRVRKIPKEHLFGLFFIKKSYESTWDFYYHTIDALRPLFGRKDFNQLVSGFYLNRIRESVRISYFVSERNKQKAISIFQSFFKEKAISEFETQPPRKIVVAEKYGGEELEERFRFFLALETQIGLELMKADLLHARSLFATYIFQVYKGRLPIREHFEPTFLRHSQTFISLSNEERKQFFEDLENHPGWMHMMVNFVFGYDFRRHVYPDGIPLPIPRINEILERNNVGFQIPLAGNQCHNIFARSANARANPENCYDHSL
jgi:hypothetical protein